MKSEKMTNYQVALEMVRYYSEDNSRRGTTVNGCVYLSPEGNKCAVGRMMNELGLRDYGNYGEGYAGLIYDMCEASDGSPHIFFKPEYRHLVKASDVDGWGVFLEDLQRIHDDASIWELEFVPSILDKLNYVMRRHLSSKEIKSLAEIIAESNKE